ncbi:hypothetical protein [Siccirubricoccus sp. G192]|uniref:hypothetical protein n=1 Tax=Siccirubricoccus sp. G192 TaxID=2849651 RepID=UPI001C2BFC87|nr:hypothetical protein [Siccirubricoccus sp. G192]MBV1800635.1 hypothetical protein [Siccirubricoccus sp. G192]MBV1800700.1 hypothetical protein [Siccirubricoccus sp. G192]
MYTRSTDDGFQVYLSEMLATTFVLTEGVRLKPVFIEWSGLTKRQQTLALARVRQVCTDEVRALPSGSRLHVEFNEMTDDLHQLLIEVAGENNPDFTWSINSPG